MSRQTVFTIGHSTHTQDYFIELLKRHGITALCDVRSKPYSRFNPQFNREDLKRALEGCGIAYVFLGRELGAQSDDPACYENGKVQYERLAQSELFRNGLARIQEGMQEYRVALMCSEKEPLECHRTILVARQLTGLGLDVQHVHADGTLESDSDAAHRLAVMFNLAEEDLFRSREDLLEEAYRRQEDRIAFETTAAPANHGTSSQAAG